MTSPSSVRVAEKRVRNCSRTVSNVELSHSSGVTDRPRYGVLAFSITQRTSELGLRAAVGARPVQIMALVVREGMAPTIIGLCAGGTIAAVGGRVLAGQLYSVSPYDPGVFLGATAVLSAAALMACWLPARRAARLSPLWALRAE